MAEKVNLVNRMRYLLDGEKRKRLIENYFSLTVLQGANYLLPLITLPYLIRILGAEKYGLVLFAQAFIQYFIIFTDYGFSLSATRGIALHRGNASRVSEIFCSIFVIKTAFILIGFCVMSLVVFTFSKFRHDWMLYYLCYGAVIGHAYFPTWFFQGMEKMKYIAALNILGRVFYTVSVFIFIRTPNDYMIVPLLNSLGFILVGSWAFFVAVRRFHIKLMLPSPDILIKHLKDGWHIFVGMISSSLSAFNVVFILGLLTSNTVVGYYAPLEKIARAVASLVRPVSQTVFPHLANLSRDGLREAYNLSRKITLISSGVMLIVSIALFLFSSEIISFVLGYNNPDTFFLFRILAFHPFIFSIVNIYCNQNMIIYGFHGAYSVIYIVTFIYNISFSILLISTLGNIGAAIVVLTTDLLVMALIMTYLKIKIPAAK